MRQHGQYPQQKQKWWRCAAASLSLASIAFSAPAIAQSDEDGRELYRRYQCWQCHGYEAQGGAAPRIAATEYPFDAFARFVRHPNLMPAYPPNILSDAELRGIYKFVRSIPKPPPLSENPVLREL